MLRLKDLELVFSTNDTVHVSFFIDLLFALHVFNFHPRKTHIYHANMMSLELEAPSKSDVGRNVRSLVRWPMMMELSLVLNDQWQSWLIITLLLNLLAFGERGRTRPCKLQLILRR
jgi:hypothetical protein